MLYSTRTIVFLLAAVVCVFWLLGTVFVAHPLRLIGDGDFGLQAGTASGLVATFAGCALGCAVDDYNAQRPLPGVRLLLRIGVPLFVGCLAYLWFWSDFTQEARPVVIFGAAVAFVSPLLSALTSSDPKERNDFSEHPRGCLPRAVQRVFEWTNRIF